MLSYSTAPIRYSLGRLANSTPLLRNLKDRLRTRSWCKAGKPAPPPHVIKQRIVSAYASKFGIDTFIETGTYRGDMVYAMKTKFKSIVSIELSPVLCKNAQNRFRAYSNIEIRQGDSAAILPQVLRNTPNRCLFWLDGHYSSGVTARGQSDTPILKEVEAILAEAANSHVLLIDDARCFDGTHDYPCLVDLRMLVNLLRPDYTFEVLNDVIRVHPPHPHQSDI